MTSSKLILIKELINTIHSIIEKSLNKESLHSFNRLLYIAKDKLNELKISFQLLSYYDNTMEVLEITKIIISIEAELSNSIINLKVDNY